MPNASSPAVAGQAAEIEQEVSLKPRHLTSRLILAGLCLLPTWPSASMADGDRETQAGPVRYQAPAGDRPATRETVIDGQRAAVLPNGRLLTPAGREIGVDAPKP